MVWVVSPTPSGICPALINRGYSLLDIIYIYYYYYHYYYLYIYINIIGFNQMVIQLCLQHWWLKQHGDFSKNNLGFQRRRWSWRCKLVVEPPETIDSSWLGKWWWTNGCWVGDFAIKTSKLRHDLTIKNCVFWLIRFLGKLKPQELMAHKMWIL